MGRPRSGEAPKAEGPTFIEPEFAGIVPKCTDKEAYRWWLGETGLTNKSRNNFCRDCTPQYQAERMAEGRCENTDVVFRKDSDGLLEGIIYRIPRRGKFSAPAASSRNSARKAIPIYPKSEMAE